MPPEHQDLPLLDIEEELIILKEEELIMLDDKDEIVGLGLQHDQAKEQ